MKTFLEVEGKMGPIPQPTSNQYRPPQPDTNPKVRKDNAAEKRKRAVPTKRFRPCAAPKPDETAMQLPVTVSKVPEALENRPPPLEKAQVYKSTPWPGAGKMSGNLFEDRNWLLPPNYLNNDCKIATNPRSPIKEEPKTGEQSNRPNAEKCGWGTKLSILQKSGKGRMGWQTPKPTEGFSPTRSTKTPSKMSSNPKLSEAPRHREVYPRDTI